IIGRQQQLLRADFETQPSHEVLAESLSDYEELLPQNDAVILSDYGKGGLAHIARMIAAARDRNRPVLVDPKGDDYERYRGATLITPNRAEFREVAGSWKSEGELANKAQRLRRDLDLQAVLLTRSDEGMTLYREAGAVHV
ncbi:MAG: PfkB family carbohydrate kinase, partial [Burkholderiales bacterium]